MRLRDTFRYYLAKHENDERDRATCDADTRGAKHLYREVRRNSGRRDVDDVVANENRHKEALRVPFEPLHTSRIGKFFAHHRSYLAGREGEKRYLDSRKKGRKSDQNDEHDEVILHLSRATIANTRSRATAPSRSYIFPAFGFEARISLLIILPSRSTS